MNELKDQHKSSLKEYLIKSQKTEKFLQASKATNKAGKGLLSKKTEDFRIKKNVCDGGRTAIVDVFKTVNNYVRTGQAEISFRKNTPQSEMLLTFLIDSSGSMMKDKQIAFVKGLIRQTIERHAGKRIRYASVALVNNTAIPLVYPERSPEKLIETLNGLASGGKTNMNEGFTMINQVLKESSEKAKSCHLFILTDGKINLGDTKDPFSESIDTYKRLLFNVASCTVVDMESGFVKMAMAEKLAGELGVKYISMHNEKQV